MPEHVSNKIKITQADLDGATKALRLTTPVYAASRHGGVITLSTRYGLRICLTNVPTRKIRVRKKGKRKRR